MRSAAARVIATVLPFLLVCMLAATASNADPAARSDKSPGPSARQTAGDDIATPGSPAPPARDGNRAAPRGASKPKAAARISNSAESWATQSARRLVGRAARFQRQGDLSGALRVYLEAIRMDSTYGPAYLGMAQCREQLGDRQEAERIYTRAAQLRSVAAEALARRAALRRRSGKKTEALRDLESALALGPSSPGRLLQLAAWYVQQRAWPAALALHRKRLAQLESTPASAELNDSRVKVRALSRLADSADPVTAGDGYPSWVRRSLSAIARQQ